MRDGSRFVGEVTNHTHEYLSVLVPNLPKLAEGERLLVRTRTNRAVMLSATFLGIADDDARRILLRIASRIYESDDRTDRRHPTRMLASIEVGPRSVPAELVNVSPNGAAVDCEMAFARLQKINVSIETSEGQIKCAAEVRHCYKSPDNPDCNRLGLLLLGLPEHITARLLMEAFESGLATRVATHRTTRPEESEIRRTEVLERLQVDIGRSERKDQVLRSYSKSRPSS